jgi:hypothetical protein
MKGSALGLMFWRYCNVGVYAFGLMFRRCCCFVSMYAFGLMFWRCCCFVSMYAFGLMFWSHGIVIMYAIRLMFWFCCSRSISGGLALLLKVDGSLARYN